MNYTIHDILQWIEKDAVEYVDMQFDDMFGKIHHITLSACLLDENKLKDGFPFDGSSIRAWKSIEQSDMLFVPDVSTAFLDPFRNRKTLVIYGNIRDPRTGDLYHRSPRNIINLADQYLRSTGIGTDIFFGAEPEFFIFDKIAFEVTKNLSLFHVDSHEGPWNSSNEEGEHGHTIQHKEGYLPVTPQDSLMDLRSEITSHMMNMGLTVDLHHHEVGTAQCEIGIRYNSAVFAGDDVYKYKYAVKNTAVEFGKSATFMPKPLYGDNGSGMHIHTSIWKDGKNLFAGDKYASLSQEALYAIGGLLKHGRSIQAFTNPTLNSYRRLVPGYEAPVRLAYSAINRSAAIRVPYVHNDKARRFEFRCADASGSPYLSFAAMTMAMIDGIRNHIDPGSSLDKNIYDMPIEELADVPATCSNLETALEELKKDNDYLTVNEVFSDDFINAYINFKMENEVMLEKIHPTPLEYKLYYSL